MVYSIRLSRKLYGRAILVFCLTYVTGVQIVWAQSDSTSVRFDPVFLNAISSQISYPPEAEALRMQAKIYAGFTINEEGHVQTISIINPEKIGHGFEEEVQRGLKRLPPLSHKYAGKYVMPFTFMFPNETAFDSLPSYFYSGYILLPEFIIVNNHHPFRSVYLPSSWSWSTKKLP